MARNHLRFSVDAWRDPDWLALSIDAQWLFVAILSQPKMTLVGSIDINPLRWAGLSPQASVDSVNAALDELEAGRFVVTDLTTGELLVRSFTKNDLAPSRLSPQIAKGFWSAWKGLSSPVLRQAVLENCPVDIWEKLERHAPDDALHNRRSAPIDSEVDSQSIAPIDNPTTGSLLPEASSQQPSDDAAAALKRRTDLFHAAIDVLVERSIARHPATTNPHGYEHALRKGKRSDHYDRAMEFIDAWGDDDDPEFVAQFLEPHLFPTMPASPPLRLACGTCSSSGWVDGEPDASGRLSAARPCPECNEVASA